MLLYWQKMSALCWETAAVDTSSLSPSSPPIPQSHSSCLHTYTQTETPDVGGVKGVVRSPESLEFSGMSDVPNLRAILAEVQLDFLVERVDRGDHQSWMVAHLAQVLQSLYSGQVQKCSVSRYQC